MNHPQALVAAALLGLLAAALNWLYLQNKTAQVQSISLLGIRKGVSLQAGEVLNEQHLAEVRVPQRHAGNLKESVYLYKDRGTMVGVRATRPYQGGDLVYRQDYRTPPPELKLEPRQRLLWIPVDGRSFVAELVDPGDQITFLVPTYEKGAGTGAAVESHDGLGEPSGPAAPVGTELIGPFRIASLGNRLGSRRVMQAAGRPAAQEGQVGVVVQVEGEHLEAKAMRLLQRLQQNNYRHVGVVLHPRPAQRSQP